MVITEAEVSVLWSEDKVLAERTDPIGQQTSWGQGRQDGVTAGRMGSGQAGWGQGRQHRRGGCIELH